MTKELLARALELPTDRVTLIKSATGAEGIAEIERATAIGWIDFGLHMRLSDAIRAQVGAEGNVQLWTRLFHELSRRAILDSFFSGMIRLSRTPDVLFRRSAGVYGLLTRDIGTYAYRPAEQERCGHIDLDGFPSAQHDTRCYAEGLLGSLRAAMERTDPDGTVELETVDSARGHVRYTLSW